MRCCFHQRVTWFFAAIGVKTTSWYFMIFASGNVKYVKLWMCWLEVPNIFICFLTCQLAQAWWALNLFLGRWSIPSAMMNLIFLCDTERKLDTITVETEFPSMDLAAMYFCHHVPTTSTVHPCSYFHTIRIGSSWPLTSHGFSPLMGQTYAPTTNGHIDLIWLNIIDI